MRGMRRGYGVFRQWSLPRHWRRSFGTDNNIDGAPSGKLQIFDRYLKRKQRDRAAWLMSPKDSLVDAVADNLLDRLEDCKKTFPTGLCLGGSLEAVRRLLRGRGSAADVDGS